MSTRHEGLQQATNEAEMNSKRAKSELYVIKSLSGGLHYKVVDKIDSLKPGEKVMAHYKDGLKVK